MGDSKNKNSSSKQNRHTIAPYIFLTFITVVILLGGYYFFIYSGKIQAGTGGDIVSRLTAFYATLFTAIAVIAALIALTAWRGFKEMREKLESFKDFEDKVKFIKEKKELAEWVQEQFDEDDDKRILTSLAFELSEEEKGKLRKIENNVRDENIEDSWLKLIYAKQLLDDLRKNVPYDEKDYIKVETIFDYIRKRGIFKDDSVIEQRLCHLKGLMYWSWYKFKKDKLIRNNEGPTKKDWNNKWWKQKVKKGKYKGIELLEKSKEYYMETLEIFKKKKINNKDETLNNLALVFIEMAKFDPQNTHTAAKKRKEYLEIALGHLEESLEEDFNNCWDRARALYYLEKLGKDEQEWSEVKIDGEDEISDWLRRAARRINTIEDKEFFIKTMDSEVEEKIWNEKVKGFPGNKDVIEDLEKELNKRPLVRD